MTLPLSIPHDKLETLCKRWRITELAIFGSALRDDFGPESDVDVLVTFAEDSTCSYWDWPELQDDLKELLGTDRKIDIVIATALRNPFRRSRILSTKQVLYAA